VVGDVSVVDGRLDPLWQYSQIPAFSASDRAVIDVLTTTHAGRLAVVELKADEDIHLPLQGWTTGHAWNGTTLAANSPASDISAARNFLPKNHYCFCWLLHSTSIPPRTRCCVTFRRNRMAVRGH